MESSTTTVTRTTVVTEQPAVGQSQTVIIRGSQAEHGWSSDLCDCMQDKKSCLLAFLCTPCFDCYLATRMNEACCIPIIVPGGEVAMRTKLRTKENIYGSICDDCLKCYFCPCCALAQMSRELDHIDHKI